MNTDASYGIIPIHVQNNNVDYLLIQHNAGHWAFPKGHAEGRESPIEAARREFIEETGITDIDLIKSAVFTENYTFTKKAESIRKTVTYFLGKTSIRTVKLQKSEIQNYIWAPYPLVRERITFEEGRVLLDDVNRYVTNNITGGESVG